jgi:hypothetical protein
VQYKHFDFHVQCHKNSDPMMDLVEKFVCPTNILKSGIFTKTFRVVTEKIDGHAIERVISIQNNEQSGVVRTNCIDCLDRTNVA